MYLQSSIYFSNIIKYRGYVYVDIHINPLVEGLILRICAVVKQESCDFAESSGYWMMKLCLYMDTASCYKHIMLKLTKVFRFNILMTIK